MKANLTMLVHNRPKLTKQALATIGHHDEVLVLDDCSNEETKSVLQDFDVNVYALGETKGTGYARNKVIEMSEKIFGRSEYLYLSDNDVWFFPGWLETLIACYEEAWKHGFRVLGAYNHPYHLPIAAIEIPRRLHLVEEVHALALQSMLMRWEVWDKYGPFDITPPGRVRMSEDVAFTNKLKSDGGRVGVVSPALLVNTGVTDSFGEKIPGYDLVKAECPAGVYCE